MDKKTCAFKQIKLFLNSLQRFLKSTGAILNKELFSSFSFIYKLNLVWVILWSYSFTLKNLGSNLEILETVDLTHLGGSGLEKTNS